MRARLFNLLRCPSCKNSFGATVFEEAIRHGERDIIEGVLSCSCGAIYPVISGIPRILDNAPQLFADFYSRHGLNAAAMPVRTTAIPLATDVGRSLDRTRESFGYQWTHFSEMATDFRENFLEYIHPLEESFFPAKLGIDVGCGFGRHIYNAALFGAEMVGLDISDAIESTRKNTEHLANVHLVQANIYRSPFVEGTFDFAYSIGVLHHLPDPEGGFRCVTSLVKAGGSVFIWVYSNRRRVMNAVLECARAVTTRLPPPAQNATSFAAAVIDWGGFIVPYKALSSVRPMTPVVEKLPLPRLKIYSRYPFQVVWADWFDRLAAPIRFYYDGDDMAAWLNRARLVRTTISPTGLFGWRAYGERT
jgi:SAM-dependent methyltransferase